MNRQEMFRGEREPSLPENNVYELHGYHANCESLIAVSRHGYKTSEDLLAESGYQQAKDKGEKREIIGPVIKGFYSPVDRTKEMVNTTVENIPKNINLGDLKKYDSRMRKALDLWRRSDACEAELQRRGETGFEWYFENYHDRSYDSESPSVKDTAERIAALFYRHIQMVGRLKDNSKINLEHASHTPVLDWFVAEVFGDQIEQDPINPHGKNLIQKMGGGFKEADEFLFHSKTNERGILSATLSFRGKSYPVNLARLKKMAESWLAKTAEPT